MHYNPDKTGSNPGAKSHDSISYTTRRHGGDKRAYTRRHETLAAAREDADRASATGRDAEISRVISTSLTGSRSASATSGGRSAEAEGGAW